MSITLALGEQETERGIPGALWPVKLNRKLLTEWETLLKVVRWRAIEEDSRYPPLAFTHGGGGRKEGGGDPPIISWDAETGKS